MERISFRRAQIEDCQPLAELVNSAYRGETSKKGWTTEADLLDGQRTDPELLAEMMRDQNQVVLLAFEDKKIVGSVSLSRKEDRGYLGMLTVRPRRQASGFGRLILAEGERWVQQNWDLAHIEMTVIQKRTELIAWYERRGYQKTDRRESFPYGNEKFGKPKVSDLEFVVLEKTLV